jgi:hypothetical protein
MYIDNVINCTGDRKTIKFDNFVVDDDNTEI